jgi:hypothetical protein
MPGRLSNLYVSIRQHTSAFVSIRCCSWCPDDSRTYTSAYVSIRQHTSAFVSIRQHTLLFVMPGRLSNLYVSIRQHSSAFVSIRCCSWCPEDSRTYVASRSMRTLSSMYSVDPTPVCEDKYADVCWRMLTYADVCWRMLTYADVCWRMLTYADACWRYIAYMLLLYVRTHTVVPLWFFFFN